MKKIRINELARELEVKPGVILEMLPELGVQEKKTHSSSVDEDVALELRRRLTGSDAPLREDQREHRPASQNGQREHQEPAPAEAHSVTSAAPEADPRVPPHPPVRETPAIPISAAEPATPAGAAAESAQNASSEAERAIPAFKPLRPPLGGGSAIHPPLAHQPGQPSGPGPVNRAIAI